MSNYLFNTNPDIQDVNYDKLCADVLGIDISIRFAAVYTKGGNIVGRGMRKGVESLLIPEEATMSLFYSKHMFETRKNLSHIIGKENYSMTDYAKVKMLSVPLQSDDLLLISIEPKGDHFKIIDQVLKVIENQSKGN